MKYRTIVEFLEAYLDYTNTPIWYLEEIPKYEDLQESANAILAEIKSSHPPVNGFSDRTSYEKACST